MFGNAVIAGATRPGALVVPSSAVIRSGRRTIAVVALGEGRFEPRNVELGLDSGDGFVEVLSGIVEGEDVVVSSQFLIDSESNLQEAVRKLLASSTSVDSRDASGDDGARAPKDGGSDDAPHSAHDHAAKGEE